MESLSAFLRKKFTLYHHSLDGQQFPSLPNIAEGAADRTKQQFSNFLSNAIGSLNEIDTQLELALRLGYVTKTDYDRRYILLDGCLALTYGLRKSLRAQRRNR